MCCVGDVEKTCSGLWSCTQDICVVYKNDSVSYVMVNPRYNNLSEMNCNPTQEQVDSVDGKLDKVFSCVHAALFLCVGNLAIGIIWVLVKCQWFKLCIEQQGDFIPLNGHHGHHGPIVSPWNLPMRQRAIVLMFVGMFYGMFIAQKIICLVMLGLYHSWEKDMMAYTQDEAPAFLSEWSGTNMIVLGITVVLELSWNAFEFRELFMFCADSHSHCGDNDQTNDKIPSTATATATIQ